MGGIRIAYLNTQPFGPRRAPANWARVTQFVVFVLKKVFRARMGVYFVDLFYVEPEYTIESDRHVIKEIRTLLGLELAPDKEGPPQSQHCPLGRK